jgi:hypothetical protein
LIIVSLTSRRDAQHSTSIITVWVLPGGTSYDTYSSAIFSCLSRVSIRMATYIHSARKSLYQSRHIPRYPWHTYTSAPPSYRSKLSMIASVPHMGLASTTCADTASQSVSYKLLSPILQVRACSAVAIGVFELGQGIEPWSCSGYPDKASHVTYVFCTSEYSSRATNMRRVVSRVVCQC